MHVLNLVVLFCFVIMLGVMQHNSDMKRPLRLASLPLDCVYVVMVPRLTSLPLKSLVTSLKMRGLNASNFWSARWNRRTRVVSPGDFSKQCFKDRVDAGEEEWFYSCRVLGIDSS